MLKSRLTLMIWGLGKEYNRHFNALRYWEEQREIEILGVTDKNAPELSEIDGWRVYKTSNIPRTGVDYYLVMSEEYFSEIMDDILASGVAREKILPSRILDIPYFNWNQYLKIQKSRLSIICNNCVGGIIYHTLGLECKSPCKNLAIPNDSFLKLITNLQKYMSLELEFKRWKIDPHSQKEFPVMKLNDIEIWCNHDASVFEAKNNWDRRRKKINYENIMLIMYTEEDNIGEKFLKSTDYNKILFVSEKSRLKGENVFVLKLLPGQKELWEVVNSSAALGKNSYNYKILDMLNGKKEYRYSENIECCSCENR